MIIVSYHKTLIPSHQSIFVENILFTVLRSPRYKLETIQNETSRFLLLSPQIFANTPSVGEIRYRTQRCS